jgi:SAM-dependent methyltransferase
MVPMDKKPQIKKFGIYKKIGDYHKNISPKWSYYPLYLEKLRFIDGFLSKNAKGKKILDIGCGDGDLVEKYRNQGYDMQGLDLNYSSEFVKKGSILNLPYKNESFDVLLCLDVLQYLDFDGQEKALCEMKRVLKKGGSILLTLPNLAHFASRVYFLFTGRLMRTDSKTFPVGDRPITEYISIIRKYFMVTRRRGILPTNFIFCSLLIKKFPDKFLWLFRLINIFAYPNWCFLNLLVCKK